MCVVEMKCHGIILFRSFLPWMDRFHLFFFIFILGYNHKVFCTVLFYSFHHIIAISFATHCECVCL